MPRGMPFITQDVAHLPETEERHHRNNSSMRFMGPCYMRARRSADSSTLSLQLEDFALPPNTKHWVAQVEDGVAPISTGHPSN